MAAAAELCDLPRDGAVFRLDLTDVTACTYRGVRVDPDRLDCERTKRAVAEYLCRPRDVAALTLVYLGYRPRLDEFVLGFRYCKPADDDDTDDDTDDDDTGDDDTGDDDTALSSSLAYAPATLENDKFVPVEGVLEWIAHDYVNPRQDQSLQTVPYTDIVHVFADF